MSRPRSLLLKRLLFPAIPLALAGAAIAGDGQLLPVESPAVPGSLAPALTADPTNDSTVMTWLEAGETGHVFKASRFDGRKFGEIREIARGDDWFANWADTPGLFIADDGSWTAHWLEKSADSVYAYDVRLARSTDRGRNWKAIGSPHRDRTHTEHGFVSRFRAGSGAVGLAWLDGRRTAAGGPMTLRTATVSAQGTIGPSELLDERVCDCCRTASALTGPGPVVVYRDRSEDEIRDIAIIRKTEQGWSEPDLVHADGWVIGGCPVNGPDVIARDKKVVVAWFTMADDDPRVRVAVSDDAGQTFADPVALSGGTALGRVKLAWLPEGFALAWMDQPGRGPAELRLARFSEAGAKLDERLIGTLAAGRISGFPQVATTGDRILVAWTARERTPDGTTTTRVRTGLVEVGDS